MAIIIKIDKEAATTVALTYSGCNVQQKDTTKETPRQLERKKNPNSINFYIRILKHPQTIPFQIISRHTTIHIMVGSLLDAQATHHPRSERNSASKAEEEEEGSLPIFTEVKEVVETMQTKRPFLCRGVLSAAVLSLPCSSNGLTVEGGRDVREAKGWWQEILKLEGGETRPPHHPFVRSFARAMDMALACLTYLRRCCFYLHTNTLKWVRPTVVVSGL